MPAGPPPTSRGTTPTRSGAASELGAAMEALAAMTLEAAAGPTPSSGSVARLRRNADRLRDR